MCSENEGGNCSSHWSDGQLGPRPARVPRAEYLREVFDVAAEERPRASDDWERKPSSVREPLPWMRLAGCESLPRCACCDGPLVWRGEWACDCCRARHPLRDGYVGIVLPRSLPVEAWAGIGVTDALLEAAGGAPLFSSGEGHNSTTRETRYDALEALTSFVRASRAERLLARGARPTVDGGVVMHWWHGQRAKGEGERFARIRRCGELLFVASSSDGRSVYVEYRCGEWRACRRCEERRRYELRRGMEQVLKRAMSEFRVQMSRHYRGSEGRWAQRMITLTVPHSGDMMLDGRRLKRAWSLFRRSMIRHFRRRGVRSFPWFRATEAAGEHLHYHVWMLSPFVDQALLHVWWGRAILLAGVPPDEVPTRVWSEVEFRDGRCTRWLGLSGPHAVVPWPVVDVRGGPQSRRGQTLGQYAAKVGLQTYVTKSNGVSTRVHPVHAARAYEALLDDRMVQWAAGWAPISEQQVKWHLRRATEVERAEWLAKWTAASEAASARKQAPIDGAGDASESADEARARDGPPIETAPNEVQTHSRPNAAEVELGQPQAVLHERTCPSTAWQQVLDL